MPTFGVTGFSRSLVVAGCGYGAEPDKKEKFQAECEAAAASFEADWGARIISDHLARAWSQPVVVENRTGASGMVGTDAVAKAVTEADLVVSAVLSGNRNFEGRSVIKP